MGKCLSETSENYQSIQLNPNTEKKAEQLHLILIIDRKPKTIHQITINKTATVADLKQLIFQETGISSQCIKLSIQTLKKPLYNDQLCLIDYGIMNDTYILVQSSDVNSCFSLEIKWKIDNKSVSLLDIDNVVTCDKIKTILPQIYNRINTLPTQCENALHIIKLHIIKNKESVALDITKTFSDYKIKNDCTIFVAYPKIKDFDAIPVNYLSSIHYDDAEAVKIRKHFKTNMAIYNAKIVTMLHIEKNRKINKNVFENILSTKTRKNCYLYHGTAFYHLKTIIENGFDRDFNKRSAYGKGTYFSSNPATSSQYCQRYDSENAFYCMLVCRTIIGESAKGCQGKSWAKSDGTEYDSLVDDLKNPNIYVIKKDYHSYPEYLIIFQYLSRDRR